MLSKELRIVKLIESEDPEANNLGNLSMHSSINKDNAIYFYLLTDVHKSKLSKDVIEKLSNTLKFNSKNHALEKLPQIIEYMQKNKPHAKAINLFFSKYNDYLYGIISHEWEKTDRIETRKLITTLNGK